MPGDGRDEEEERIWFNGSLSTIRYFLCPFRMITWTGEVILCFGVFLFFGGSHLEAGRLLPWV